MAYNFTLTSVAVPFAAKFEESLPVLMHSNKQLDKEFKAGTGSTITMIIPDHPDVTTGAAVGGSLGYTSGSRTLSLVQKNVAIDANSVVRALDVHDFESQVATPYAAKLGSEIQKESVNTIQKKADRQIVFAGSALFNEVSDAVASIRAARSFGDLHGALAPGLAAKVAQSGFTFFNPSSQISDIFSNVKLGKFQTADWYTTPDVQSLNTGTLTLSANATTTAAVTAEGATTIAITDASLAGGETVVAGQAFEIAGCEIVDIYGASVGSNYAFVAQSNATATAGALSITVKPLHFAAGPLQNVSITVPSGAVVTQVQEANSSYLGGVVWDKMSLLFGSAKLAPIAGVEEKTIVVGKALAVKCSKGPDIANGREIVRWDVLTGSELVRPNWSSALWFKV